MRQWYGTSIFDEMTAELGLACQNASDVLSAKNNVITHFADEFQFLSELPTMLETQNFIFVHGGLPSNDMGKLSSFNLFDFLKLDSFIEKGLCFEKYVVVGHWPVVLYYERIPNANPIINKEQKIISIDGGCGTKTDCQLNLITIPHINCSIDEIECISYEDFPVFTAMSSQTALSDSVYIKWTDNKINVIQTEDEFTHIEHISTEKKLCVPNDFIYNNGTCLGDYTDYILPVKAGDKLSLIKKTSKGCIVKKDGITGWYYGEIR